MMSVAVADRETQSVEIVGLGERVARHRVVAGMASGFLLWTSFPPVEWNWLAWVALAPLFWLATLPGAAAKNYVAAWTGGLIFWLLALEWVRMSDPAAWLGWLAMALVFSLWWPLFLALTRWAKFRLGLPLIVAAPIVWVGLEYSRAYFLSGFPWYYLAHSQFRRLFVIQIADLTGALGISLLIAVVNALVVDLLSLPLLHVTQSRTRLRMNQNIRLCSVTVLVGSALCYGGYRLSTAEFRDGPRLALLQSNIRRQDKIKRDRNAIVAEFTGLVDHAVSQRVRPDLIVWPETAYPYGFVAIDPAIEPGELSRQLGSITNKLTVDEWVDVKNDVAGRLHSWTDRINVPMLVGISYYDHQPRSLGKYNAAMLFQPGLATTAVYHKMHLVPFGEYVPWIDTLPWLSVFTPYEHARVPRLNFGREPVRMSLGDYSLAVSICFEDTVPQVIARSFQDADGRQPDVLINLSNDGWFHGSAELDMHLAIAVFRAVEHRVPLARAVNTGLTALVDGNGAISATLPKETAGVLSETVPLDDRRSFYSASGDWLGLSCLAVTIGLVPVGIMRKLRGRHPHNR
jgi:apolipoprotein N-acyltransferase